MGLPWKKNSSSPMSLSIGTVFRAISSPRAIRSLSSSCRSRNVHEHLVVGEIFGIILSGQAVAEDDIVPHGTVVEKVMGIIKFDDPGELIPQFSLDDAAACEEIFP